MSDIYNGGIKLKIGDYELKKISSYQTKWEIEEDNFTGYDFSDVSIYNGRRFMAEITTGYLTEQELTQLQTALFKHTFEFTSGEYTGSVKLKSCSTPLKKADCYGKYYTVSFAVSAVELTGGSGSL